MGPILYKGCCLQFNNNKDDVTSQEAECFQLEVCSSIHSNQCDAQTHVGKLQSTHTVNRVHRWSSVGRLGASGLHELHGLLLDGLDALRRAAPLLVLQVALEEELDVFHRQREVDDAVEQSPEGDGTLNHGTLHDYGTKLSGAA